VKSALERFHELRGRPADDPQRIDLKADVSIAAVKVWSTVLDEAIWVIADDVPPQQWPTDGPVYRHAEVKILTRVGQDTLAWVHPVKQLFGARVVSGGRRPHQAPECNQDSEDPKGG